MPNGIRDKKAFSDVAYDGRCAPYATIAKRLACVRITRRI